jgi:2-oxoglutarate dehydrogenase E2 component (dihydrolipoamide succinyltransferase)
MDSEIKINLPKLGESIVSATVVQWFKKEGDLVGLDEPLLEVSTDKINSEIPSSSAGVLSKILASVGQEVQVGETLATLSSKATPPGQVQSVSTSMEDFLSPSVMRLMKEKGLKSEDLSKIPHTGEGGRLTKKDIEEHTLEKSPCPLAPQRLDTERVKMSSLRKAIADNMVRSFYEAPHASLVTEVDVTELVKVIQNQKAAFFEKQKVKLTITAFVARAIARSVEAFPMINASLEGDTIVVKRFVNLGIAVSVDQGVMVPVIKDCQKKSFTQISKSIAELADKARSGKLSASEVQEGTITVTNFGMTGTMIGVPIIRYPEVAIVGLGAITRKVVVMADDSMAIRSMMWVSLTFDHRVLDGMYGCGFLAELKKHLESDHSCDMLG